MAQGWEIEYTDQFGQWWNTLGMEEQEAVEACIPALRRMGPGLGRPLVDTIKGSRHANLKELRPPGTNIRILFAFDPRRVALLLLGGDKTDRWQQWYIENIPRADALYEAHLDELRQEGELP